LTVVEVLLDLGAAVVDLQRRLDAGGDHAGVEAARGLARDAPAEHDRDPVGAPQRELVAQRLFEPLAARQRPVEDPGVGQLELAEGELVAVAAAALGGVER
jgi:hypothetical protein